MPPKKYAITNKKRPSSIATMSNPWEETQLKHLQKLTDKKLLREQSDYSSSSSSSPESSDSEPDTFNPSIKINRIKDVKPKKDTNVNIGGSVKIQYVPTDKDAIIQRPLMEAGVIPKSSNVTIMSGTIGSGKTQCLINLLLNPLCYGPDKKTGKPFFDEIFVFSNSNDDAYQILIDKKILKASHIKYCPEEEDLKVVLDKQKKSIKDAGDNISKIPQVCLIFDDIIDNKKFISSKSFKLCCIRPRQWHLSCFILVQQFYAIPRICRFQAQNLILFRGSRLEEECYYDSYCPAGMNKKQFLKLLNIAWEKRPDDTHSFLHINRRMPDNEKYRRNFDEIIDLEKLK